jgi:hypothetical protein
MSTKSFLIIAVSVVALAVLAAYFHLPAAAPVRHALSATVHGGR